MEGTNDRVGKERVTERIDTFEQGTYNELGEKCVQ